MSSFNDMSDEFRLSRYTLFLSYIYILITYHSFQVLCLSLNDFKIKDKLIEKLLFDKISTKFLQIRKLFHFFLSIDIFMHSIEK